MIALPGLAAVALVQSCIALLPPPHMDIEWFRDGVPFARDVPVRSSATERVYRRHPNSGAPLQRVLECGVVRGTAVLTERIGSATVWLPVGLATDGTANFDGATVRRIPTPVNASTAVIWYTVSAPGVRIFGVANRAGIVEVRSPAVGGGFSVLRAVLRQPPPDTIAIVNRMRAEANASRRPLDARILELTQERDRIRDSLTVLQRRLLEPPIPYSSSDVVEFIAVDVYEERGEYDDALELLLDVRKRLELWSERNRSRHAALTPLDARIRLVLRACREAQAAQSRRSRTLLCRIDASGPGIPQ